MNGILHRLARSPHPRVMASLAWLILVINPVYGAPLTMMHGVHSSTLPVAHAAQVADDCHRAAPAKADHSCCSDHDSGGISTANHTCSCAAVCCSALPAMDMAGVPAAPIPTMYWAPPRADLRSSDRAPPLRPPPV